MSKDKMTDTLDEAFDCMYDFIKDHIENYNDESEDWSDTMEYIINLECEDEIHEIADGCCPVYTGEILSCALEDLNLATEESEIGPAFDGKHTAVNIIVANIYEKICNYLYEEESNIKRQALDDFSEEFTITNKKGDK